MKTILLLAALTLSIIAGAQTTLPDTIHTNTTLDLAGSPYEAVSSVYVPGGITLTIDPGVEIRFPQFAQLDVAGTLIARGTATDPILFTSSDPNPDLARWYGIIFYSTALSTSYDGTGGYLSGSILQHAAIEWVTDNGLGGAVYTNLMSLMVDHVSIECDSNTNGIQMDNQDPNAQTARITNCTIDGGYIGVGTGLLFDGVLVEGCEISNTFFDGIFLNGSNHRVLNNRIINTGNGGQSPALTVQAGGGALISGNIIYGHNGAGIRNTPNGTGSRIVNNKVLNLDLSNSAFPFAIACEGCDSIANNVLDQTRSGILAEGAGEITITGNQFLFDTIDLVQEPLHPTVLAADLGQINDSAQISYNTFAGNDIMDNNRGMLELESNGFSVSGAINVAGNNWFDPWPTLLFNELASGSFTVNALGNFWDGNTTTAQIEGLVFDGSDSMALGMVDASSPLINPSTIAPISPVRFITQTAISGGVELNWFPNPEADLAGYKVHWGNPTGWSYDTLVDVGMATTFQVMGASLNDDIAVTAYDTDADGDKDQCEGHESWYTSIGIDDSTMLVVSVPELERAGLSWFPNPSQGTVFVYSGSVIPAQEVQFFDLNGRLAHQAATRGGTRLEFDLSELPNGIYVGRLRTETGAEAVKIVLQ